MLRIKRNISFLLFFTIRLSFSFSVNIPNHIELTDSAANYYKKGKFDLAINYYKEILADGKESWKLHFNLANCYFKINKLGFAIAHYEHALKLNPESKDVKVNLKIASDRTVDKIKTKDLFIENEIRDFVIYKLNTQHWAWVTIVSLFLSLSFFTLYYRSETSKFKKLSFWLSVVCIFIFILSFIFGKMEVNDKNNLTYAVVVEPEINLYKNPDNKSKIATLHDGTRMKILQEDGEWYNMQLSNGNEGWLIKKSVCNY